MQQPPRQRQRSKGRFFGAVQALRRNRPAQTAIAILLSLLLREALLLRQQTHRTKKRILVLADPIAKVRPLHFHNLHVMAQYMSQAGFQVTEEDSRPYHYGGGDDEVLWRGLLEYDIVVTQGLSGSAVADYAARANVPVARFVGDPECSWPDPVDPVTERPDILVIGHNKGSAPHTFSPHFSYAKQQAIPTYPHLMTASHPGVKGFLQDLKDMPRRTVYCQYNDTRGDLLGLVMIVKNESNRINTTLGHLRDIIQYYTVLDTASDDNTIEQVQELMGDVPGQIIRDGPLTSFSGARNTALRAHGSRTRWVVMADADIIIHNAWRLRTSIQRIVFHCDLSPASILCTRCYKSVAKHGEQWFDVNRIFPTQHVGTDQGWHFDYPILEIAVNDVGWDMQMLRKLNLTLQQHTDDRPAIRQKEFDLPRLLQEREANPNCSRTAFFLAVIAHNVNDLDLAFKSYGNRLTMGGNPEELYESHLRRGKLQRWWGQDPRAELVAASRVLPYRAEPLYDLALHHLFMAGNTGCPPGRLPGDTTVNSTCALLQISAAFVYAKKAAALPLPSVDTLYVDAAVYDYKAVELLSELGVRLVLRLLGAGVAGQLAALEVMKALDTRTGAPLYHRGRAHLTKLETFTRNCTNNLTWLGLQTRVPEGWRGTQ